MKILSNLIFALLLAFNLSTAAFAQTGQLQAGQIWGNPSAAQKNATGTTVGAILDREYTCSAQGNIIFRGSSLWTCLAPGASGLPLLSQGAGADLHYATLANAGLTNSSITVGGTVISLGGTAATITGLTLNGSSNTLTVLAGSQLSGQTPIANGGTGQATRQLGFNALAPAPTRAGDLMYYDGSNYVALAGNNSGTRFLQEDVNGLPSWATVAGTGTVTSVTLAAGTGISLSGTNPITSAGTITVNNTGVTSVSGAGGISGTVTTIGNLSLALNNVTVQTTSTSPTGIANATAVMMGFGSTCKLTPVYSTRVKLEFVGSVTNNNSAGQAVINVRYGTGGAPANGAALTGAQIGAPQQYDLVTGAKQLPFNNGVLITGLTPSTAYWFDLSLNTNGTGTASVVNTTCNAFEF